MLKITSLEVISTLYVIQNVAQVFFDHLLIHNFAKTSISGNLPCARQEGKTTFPQSSEGNVPFQAQTQLPWLHIRERAG